MFNDQFDRIRNITKKDISNEEITNLINLGKQTANKSVLTALICLIEEAMENGSDVVIGKQLIDELMKLRLDFCYRVQCEFEETSYILNICLSIVNCDYRTSVDIPSEKYTNDLYDKYNYLKQMAQIYWKHFCMYNGDLVNRIKEYRSDINITDLIIDEDNPTTLYFDKNSKRRIGIFCFYSDTNGKLFYKKD